MTTSELAGAWETPPAVLAAAGLALLLYAQAFWRLRRRGGPARAPWSRPVLFALAVAAAVLALVSPLDAAGVDFLLSAHMLQHVVIGDLVPALALLAVRGPLVFFLLPARALGALGRIEPLRRALGFLLRPRVAFCAWALVVGAWHVPHAYDYVLTQPVVHDLEHVTFVVAGLLVWAQLVDPARRRVLSIPSRVGFALVLFACGLVLGDVLVFSLHPLYGAYAAQPERLFGLSPLIDQRLAGIVMMADQLLTLGTCVAVLLILRQRAPANARAPSAVASRARPRSAASRP